MSCGCRTSGDSSHSCGSKSETGCDKVDTCGNSYKLNVFDWLANIKSPLNECDYVEVRFKNERKSFYHNINKLPLHIGSIVTVESSSGYDVGVVSLTGELVRIQMKKKNFGEEQASKIIRIATQKDVEIWQNSRKKEEEVKKEARKIALNLNLEMKISDIEYQGDGSKITFYYTAEGRVDFRQLIKEYAAVFRAKVDMKQIGYRQEAAKLGGIGSCGRELCCSTWLTDFRSVNTNAARYQQLSINPLKLAGQCGKLKCCLNYEVDNYVEAAKRMPSKEISLHTVDAEYFVFKTDILAGTVTYSTDKNLAANLVTISAERARTVIEMNRRGEKPDVLEEERHRKPADKPIDLLANADLSRFDKNKRPKRQNNNKQKADKREAAARQNGQQPRKEQPRQREQQPERRKQKPQQRAQEGKNDNNANRPRRENQRRQGSQPGNGQQQK